MKSRFSLTFSAILTILSTFARAETHLFDFSSGLGPDFITSNMNSLCTVSTDQQNVRITKAADSGDYKPINEWISGGIYSTFTMEGNFTITVDYSLYTFPLPTNQGSICAALTMVNPSLTSLWDQIHVGRTASAGYYFGYNGTNGHGGVPTVPATGRLRIGRSGATITNSYASLGSNSFTTLNSTSITSTPLSLSLTLCEGPDQENLRNTSAGDIAFDNLFVTADKINDVRDWQGGNVSNPADWGKINNWIMPTSVPNAAGTKVSFGNQLSTYNLVDMISQGRMVGAISFASTTSTTIQSSGGYSLTLDNNGTTSTIDVAGIHAISAPLVLNNDATISGNGSLSLSGGISGNHTLTVLGNLTASSIQVDTLTIGSTGASQAVPEPSIYVLFCMSVVGIATFTWRRRQFSC